MITTKNRLSSNFDSRINLIDDISFSYQQNYLNSIYTDLTLLKLKKLKQDEDQTSTLDQSDNIKTENLIQNIDLTINESKNFTAIQYAEAQIQTEDTWYVGEDPIYVPAPAPVNQEQTSYSLTPLGWGLVILGVGGAVALAAGGSSSNSSSDQTSDSGNTAIEGTIVAGPVVAGHGLTVSIYSDRGELLIANVEVNDDGTYKADLSSAYQGIILVQVNDSDSGVDYIDERTNQAVDLTISLRAITNLSKPDTHTINLNLATELLTRALGLSASETNISSIGTINADQILTKQTEVEEALNINYGQLISGEIKVLIDTEGNNTGTSNNYGNVLAALSAMESDSVSTEGVLSSLETLLNDPTGQASIVTKLKLTQLTDHAETVSNNPTTNSFPQYVEGIISDTTKPTLIITDNVDGIATYNDVTFTFTFLEDVIGFDTSDIVVTGGSFSEDKFTKVSSKIYTLVVTPNDNSSANITIDISADKFSDVSGNLNDAITQYTQAVNSDSIMPTVKITDNADDIISGDVTYTFTFSEDVTNFSKEDIEVSGGNKGDFVSVSASNYTLIVTPNSDSTENLTIDIAANSLNDLAGNNNEAIEQIVQAVDTAPPTLVISDTADETTSGNVTYTFTFSEDVTGFDSSDLTVNGGTFLTEDFSKLSDSVYTLIVTPNPDSTDDITIDIAADSFTDLVGNNNRAIEQSVQAADTEIPILEITSDTEGVVSSDVMYTFTFSEDVTGFTENDIFVSGGDKGTFDPSSESEYTLIVTPDADSTRDITIDVPANSFTDAAGNNNSAIDQFVQSVDTIAPTVVITDNADDVTSDDVTYIFTFSEDVTGFTENDIDIGGGTISSFNSDSASVYTIVVAPDSDSTDDITIDIAADRLTDLAGNNNAAIDRAIQAVDTLAPTLPDNTKITIVDADDDYINNSEKNSFIITGIADAVESGATVSLNISDEDDTTIENIEPVTAQADGSFSFTGINVGNLVDGELNFSFTATDDLGNVSDVLTKSIILDTTTINPDDTKITIATDDKINESEKAAVTIVGAAGAVENGATVDVSISDNTNPNPVTFSTTANNDDGSFSIIATDSLDVTGLDYGELTFSFTATDAAGNESGNTDIDIPFSDPEIVIFDLVEGVSSDHSLRTFDDTLDYKIYIRVDSNSETLNTTPTATAIAAGATWGTWTGANNLDATDYVILVGSNSHILAVTGGASAPLQYSSSIASSFNYWFTPSSGVINSTAFKINYSGSVTR
ncbi:MAG: hypothetical protein HQL46_00535, partial [Gammaproteobacteria bacterium]|nr:hypothetical protein [Gammaproteobacteria bacterium]